MHEFKYVHVCYVYVHARVWPVPLRLYSSEEGAVAQSVERANPCEEVPSSIPAVVAHSLLVGSVSV